MEASPGTSSPGSASDHSSIMLTPSRKIKALLAQFDDSDSDKSPTRAPPTGQTSDPSNGKAGGEKRSIDSDSDDEDAPRAPLGRLAARMQASAASLEPSRQPESAMATVSAQAPESDDELQQPARKKLLKRKRSASTTPRASPQSSPHARVATPTSLTPDPSQTSPNELPEPAHGSKLLALVAKHRQQRQEQEVSEAAKKAERLKRLKEALSGRGTVAGTTHLTAMSDDSDMSDAAGEALTQQARPTRKASKKALEEMHRETQRMSRGMQLAHQAQTKKKLPKTNFLTNFGAEQKHHRSASDTATSGPGSDSEGRQTATSPPTSPLQDHDPEKPAMGHPENAETIIELPEIDDLLARRRAKGKQKVVSIEDDSELAPVSEVEQADATHEAEGDSDLEIATSNISHQAFDRAPDHKPVETHPHLLLRSLANLHAPKKQPLGTVDMQTQLRLAARTQAYRERLEKLDQLRAKRVFIPTAEEREQEEQDVEDLVEQERIKARDLQRKEKEMAKKDGTFVKDELDSDGDDEDEDDANFESEVEELSGSEVEESESEGESNAGSDKENEDLIEREADEASDENSDEGSLSSAESEEEVPSRPVRRRAVVVSDDEEDEPKISPVQNKTPQSVLRSARKVIPGLMMSDDLPMGLTQAFAATLADSQTQDVATQEQDSLAWTGNLPSPEFRRIPTLQHLDSVGFVANSQPEMTQPIDLDLLTQVEKSPAAPQHPIWESQDLEALAVQQPQSTVDTVLIPTQESPLVQRAGRLRRGRFDSDSESEAEQEDHAFAVMKRAARRAQQVLFDKPRSNAKEAIDEVAEESEDEYAGLGGASDDEGGEENDDDREMIDLDEKVGQGDEGKLAGFYA